MTFSTSKSKLEPISVEAFLRSGEYDQGDVALIAYDDLYDYLHAISIALDETGIPCGNEHEDYTIIQRIVILGTIKDSLWRTVDALRAAKP